METTFHLTSSCDSQEAVTGFNNWSTDREQCYDHSYALVSSSGEAEVQQ